MAAKLIGGQQFAMHLQGLAKKITGARAVRVGFFEGEKYPDGDGGARLRSAAKKLTADQRAAHPDWKPRLDAWAASAANGGPSLSVAQVAFWNEFGTSHAPARPFFRNMITQESPLWGEKLAALVRRNGYDGTAALSLLGENIKDALVNSIRSWPADNAELTAYIKGFNKGLTDTTVMQRAIGYEVRK